MHVFRDEAIAHLRYGTRRDMDSNLWALCQADKGSGQMSRIDRELLLNNTPSSHPDVNTDDRKRVAGGLALAACTWTVMTAVSAAYAADVSSAPCTRETDFQPGTVVMSESRDNLSPTTSRSKTETLARETFAGADPVVSLHTSYLNNVPFYLTKTYAEIKDRQLIRYGDRHGDGASLVTSTYSPPPATPIDLQPGQTVTVNYKNKAQSAGGTVEFDISEKLTYNGRETLTTALGTVDTCKFTNEITTGGAARQVVVVHNWFPVDGPYRGQSIRSVTPAFNGVPERISEIINMKYSTR